jgi:hypothetical protein
MSAILYPKFQFEVRYTHILNFSNIAREIISPFIKLCNSFNFFNEGTKEETIRLIFEDDFFIDVRWDKIILLSERNPNRFDDENSQITVFFKILKKLQETISFGKFNNYYFLLYLVKLSDETSAEILGSFKKKYFHDSVDKLLPNANDYSVVLQRNDDKKNKQEQISTGPYSYRDNSKHTLLPFNSAELNELQLHTVKGRMLYMMILEDITDMNFKILRDLIKQADKYDTYLDNL